MEETWNDSAQESDADNEAIQVSITEEPIEEITVEELLISCVCARPPLWDSRLPLKDRTRSVRDQLWTEIFREFGESPQFSVEFLTKKWRNLRDTYVRLKGEYTPTGSAAKKKKKWEFYDNLSFLNETILFRPTVSNVTKQVVPSPESSPDEAPVKKPDPITKPQKIEGAIIEALNKINAPEFTPSAQPTPTPVIGNPPINPICSRISDLLTYMPPNPRTTLEIKLLQVAFEGAKHFLN